MNKKLLFGIMSLAALAACTNDDFENQSAVAEQTSPIQFEVINNDASMRATMNGSSIVWSANDGDLFTLYHGGAVTGTPLYLNDYQNATYKAGAEDGKAAKLTTPSMILAGKAIMTWPVDTMFTNAGGANKLAIQIPTEQTDIANQIPYVSDLIDIAPYAKYDADDANAYNNAGYNRTYPVFMRPMASQLTLKAEYAGKDKIDELVNDATDPIKDITIDNIELETTTGTEFTKKIALTFTAKTTGAGSDEARWNAAVPTNAWSHVTGFDVANIATTGAQTTKLTSACPISGEKTLTNGCKFLILPQGDISDGVKKAAVTVNTYYGKVLIANPDEYAKSKYTVEEYNAAWYRYVSDAKAASTEENASTPVTDGEFAGKHKVVAKSVAFGMQQTINDFSGHKAGSGVVKGEPVGYALTRFVKVDLSKLDMSELHIKNEKQLSDVARVWKKMNLGGVVVYLDGDDKNEFKISQKTIDVIHTVNAGKALAKQFRVKPCNVGEHKACNTIVITGGDNVPEDLTFIEKNGSKKVDVAFNADDTWNWKGTVKVQAGTNLAISNFINRGTMQNAKTATLKVANSDGTKETNVPFVNNGTWNITAGDLTVKFDVTNNGTVNIYKDAEYHQDIYNNNGTDTKTTFVNDATTLPERFGVASPKIGQINNSGVFGVTGNTTVKGEINNYGLIEHLLASAKTLITNNATGTGFGAEFAAASNKIGRINLKWDNRNEEFVSISNGEVTTQGFVSVTVDGEVSTLGTEAGALGAYVNYIIIKSGVTEIQALDTQYKYVEIADTKNNEISWKTGSSSSYTGLIVLSPVNIARGTTVTVTGSTYLKAKVYVGGSFTPGSYVGYYGNTSDITGKVITY